MSAITAVRDLVVQLARDSFAVVANPRRRRLRNGDGNFHCDYRTCDELRQISRWQEYHASTYGGMLSSWATHLGAPVWVPATQDPDWNRAAAAYLAQALLDKRHDVRRRFGWEQYVRLIALAIARDGQCGIGHTVYGAGQLIEAERLVDVAVNRTGEIIEWQVADLRNGQLDLSTRHPIAAAMIDVPQIITRSSQFFGVPICFSSLDDHDGIADLWQAEIDSAAEAARPWLTLEERAGGEGLPGGQTIPQALAAGAPTTAIPGGGGRDSAPAGWVRTPNGNIMGIPSGLTSKVHQPGRPNTDVPEFSKSMMRIVSMVLLPYELAFQDQSEVSFSNGRGIRQLGNQMLGSFRRTYLNAPLARQAHGLLRAGLAANALPMRADWMLGAWKWPEIPEHDRLKERQADAADIENGTATLKDLLGENWSTTLDQAGIEESYRITAALKRIVAAQRECNLQNAQVPGLNLHWSHLMTIGGATSSPAAYLQGAVPNKPPAVEEQPGNSAAVAQPPADDRETDAAAVLRALATDRTVTVTVPDTSGPMVQAVAELAAAIRAAPAPVVNVTLPPRAPLTIQRDANGRPSALV